MIIKSIAKINVGLRIIGKREDGFHEIETIFYPLYDFYDEMDINIKPSNKKSNSLKINSNNRFVPKDRTNICYKAVTNFFRKFDIRSYFDIDVFINKKIPIGGGLGGGSSNAATLIKFLLKYFKIDIAINKKSILELAEATGSDVPFFLISKPCYAEGKGEKLKILENFRLDYYILIVTPNSHISTGWAYETLNITPGNIRGKILNSVTVFDLSNNDIFINEFENTVFSKYKNLEEIKKTLISKGSVFASLSGSGSTVYGLFKKSMDAELKQFEKIFGDRGYFYKIVL